MIRRFVSTLLLLLAGLLPPAYAGTAVNHQVVVVPALTPQSQRISKYVDGVVPIPAIITSPTATATGSTTGTLGWVEGANTLATVIEYATASDGTPSTWLQLAEVAAGTLTYGVTGLTQNTHYYFRYLAQSDYLTAQASDVANFVTDPSGGAGSVPAAPTNFACIPNPSSPTTQLLISWDDTADETAYEIWWLSTVTGQWEQAGADLAADTTSLIKTPGPNQDRQFKMLAKNTHGDGAFTNVVACSTTPASPGVNVMYRNTFEDQSGGTHTYTATTLSATASDQSYNSSSAGIPSGRFRVGEVLYATGFTGGNIGMNGKPCMVASVTTSKIVCAPLTPTLIVDDAAGESVTLTGENSNPMNTKNRRLIGTTIAASSTNLKFTDSGNGFTADCATDGTRCFHVGERVTIAGFTGANAGMNGRKCVITSIPSAGEIRCGTTISYTECNGTPSGTCPTSTYNIPAESNGASIVTDAAGETVIITADYGQIGILADQSDITYAQHSVGPEGCLGSRWSGPDAFIVSDPVSFITAITKANPGVVTYTGPDPVSGNTYVMQDIVGMYELNGVKIKVASLNTGAKTFSLTTVDGTNINTSSYGTYLRLGSIGDTTNRVLEVRESGAYAEMNSECSTSRTYPNYKHRAMIGWGANLQNDIPPAGDTDRSDDHYTGADRFRFVRGTEYALGWRQNVASTSGTPTANFNNAEPATTDPFDPGMEMAAASANYRTWRWHYRLPTLVEKKETPIIVSSGISAPYIWNCNGLRYKPVPYSWGRGPATVSGAFTGNAVALTAITKANPGVAKFTQGAASISTVPFFKIVGAGGMTQINGVKIKFSGCSTAAGVTSCNMTDENGANLDTSAYGTYTSGATLEYYDRYSDTLGGPKTGVWANYIGQYSGNAPSRTATASKWTAGSIDETTTPLADPGGWIGGDYEAMGQGNTFFRLGIYWGPNSADNGSYQVYFIDDVKIAEASGVWATDFAAIAPPGCSL